MLPVTAIQNRTPVTFVVFFKTGNSVFHRFASKSLNSTHGSGWIIQVLS
jgi:hypothetical protein